MNTVLLDVFLLTDRESGPSQHCKVSSNDPSLGETARDIEAQAKKHKTLMKMFVAASSFDIN